MAQCRHHENGPSVPQKDNYQTQEHSSAFYFIIGRTIMQRLS